MKVIVAVILAMTIIGCASFQADNGGLRMAVQYGTLKYIKSDPEKASHVVIVANDALLFLNDEQTTVDALYEKARSKIDWDSLGAEDTILLDALLLQLKADLDKRIGNGILRPEQRVSIAETLKWIRDAAAMVGGR